MSTATTVSRIANVIIPVADQDRALEFYTDKLGLEKRLEAPFGEHRWIEVAPAGAQTVIALCPPGPGETAGAKETGITLLVDDIDAYHDQLRSSGVDVDEAVSRFGEGVPPMFWFRDPEGNRLMAVAG